MLCHPADDPFAHLAAIVFQRSGRVGAGLEDDQPRASVYSKDADVIVTKGLLDKVDDLAKQCVQSCDGCHLPADLADQGQLFGAFAFPLKKPGASYGCCCLVSHER